MKLIDILILFILLAISFSKGLIHWIHKLRFPASFVIEFGRYIKLEICDNDQSFMIFILVMELSKTNLAR